MLSGARRTTWLYYNPINPEDTQKNYKNTTARHFASAPRHTEKAKGTAKPETLQFLGFTTKTKTKKHLATAPCYLHLKSF
jgi:hypothetical protein